MNQNLYQNWMTDYLLHETDPIRVTEARSVLKAWDDKKVRRIERYLYRIHELCRVGKFALELESRLKDTKRLPRPFIEKLTRNERLAINFLRLAAKGAGLNDADTEDRKLYDNVYTELAKNLERQKGERVALSNNQSKIAKMNRNNVTKGMLETYRENFRKKHDNKDRGWKKAACLDFRIDNKTLNNRMKE